MRKGTPANGPLSSPSTCLSASGMVRTMAVILLLTATARARAAASSSAGVTCLVATSSARPVASYREYSEKSTRPAYAASRGQALAFFNTSL